MIEYSIDFLILPILIFGIFFVFQTKINTDWNIRLASWLVSRELFYRHDVARGDEVWINLLRIVLGGFLLYRFTGILEFVLPLDPNNTTWIALWAYLALIVMFIAGLLAPITTLLLLVYQLHFNFVLKTYTLGVDVTAMILTCMVLYPVGRVLSVDAWLANRVPFIQKVYHWFVFSKRDTQIVTAKMMAFFSYCLLCLYSVLLHLDEPLWLNGDAAIHLLGSSYLSKYYSTFQELFAISPFAVWTAKFSMMGMVIWYFLLGPAVLIGGILRKLALLWAVAFFILSTFVLQLSILGYIEFILFGLLFWTNMLPKKIKKINMLYDDRCNLCDRTVRFLRVIDLAGVIVFLPISANQKKASHVGVSPRDLRNDLYSWEEGEEIVYSGYNFYLHISRRLVLLYAIYPFLLFFKWVQIGPLVYRYVAQRRIKMFGVCKLPVDTGIDDRLLANAPTETGLTKRGFYSPFLLTSLCFSVVFILIMPISPLAASIQKNYPNIVGSAHILSWSRINVFNEDDLRMTSHYFVLSTQEQKKINILPFTDYDGSRLDWHSSDRVYFGNSLKWRRAKNYKPVTPPSKFDFKIYCEAMKWAKSKDFNYSSGLRIDLFEAEWPLIETNKVTYYPAQRIGQLILTPEKCGMV